MAKPFRELSIRNQGQSSPISPAAWELISGSKKARVQVEPLTATVNAFGQSLVGEFGEDALRVQYQRTSYQFTGDPLNLDWAVARQVPIRFRLYLPMDRYGRVQVGWSWSRLTERSPMLVRPYEMIGGWDRAWKFVAAELREVSASFQLKDDDGVREIGKLTIECRAIVERIQQLDPMSSRCGIAGGNGVIAVDMASIGDVVRRFVEYRQSSELAGK